MAKSKKENKISQEELDQLTQVKQKVTNLKSAMGNWVLKEESLKEERKQLSLLLQQIKNEELELTKQLNEKYGKVNISLVTGEFEAVD